MQPSTDTTFSHPHIQLSRSGNASWIAVDDGKVNAMSGTLLDSISAALADARQAALPVVISGRPGIFSAGFDMKVLGSGDRSRQQALLNKGIDLIAAMLSYPLPIVCLCSGHAYPMGAFMLLSADYRIGASGDWRIGLNEVAIAMTVPPFALALAEHRLTRPGLARVGTAGLLAPAQAREYGYLDEVVDAADLHTTAARVVEEFAALDLPSYQATKQAMNHTVLQRVLGAKAMFL